MDYLVNNVKRKALPGLKNAFIAAFLVFLVSACASAFIAAYNPNNIPEPELARIEIVSQWPNNYRLISINGVDAPGLSDPMKSYMYRRSAPGEHVVEWSRRELGELREIGLLRVHFEPGETYSLGTKERGAPVSIWNKQTGEVVSSEVSLP